jgi:hypothetical protein
VRYFNRYRSRASLAAGNEQPSVRQSFGYALRQRIGLAKLGALSRILSRLIRPGQAHQAAEQALRPCLFFGVQPGKLGLGPSGQRVGNAFDFVVSSVGEPPSFATLPDLSKGKLDQGQTPRFASDIAQNTVDQTRFKFEPHELGGRGDALTQFVGRQRADVNLHRRDDVAELSVKRYEMRASIEERDAANRIDRWTDNDRV